MFGPQSAQYAIHAQSLFLKLLARMPVQPKQVPLWMPRCTLSTGGSRVAHLYDELFCRALYESPKPLPESPRILDAGGHLGTASLYYLSRYPSCTLTVFEPNPMLARLLRKNLAPWDRQATVHEAALSLESGTSTFHITTDNPFNVTGGLSNREAAGREVTRLTVQCVDAREALAQPVDLLKLDVEGHEYQLLKLDDFQPQRVRNLVIEFHDVDRRRAEFLAVSGLLFERGYQVASAEHVALGRDDVSALRGCPVLKFY